jgi:hypothetical protein
MDFEVDRI